jgi:hypothetical protein
VKRKRSSGGGARRSLQKFAAIKWHGDLLRFFGFLAFFSGLTKATPQFSMLC